MMRMVEVSADAADTDDNADDHIGVFSPETPFSHQKRYWTEKRYQIGLRMGNLFNSQIQNHKMVIPAE